MKLWVDDVRPAPEGYWLAQSVSQAKLAIQMVEDSSELVELIDIDHDAGEYANDGGDYINLLNWLEETNRNYPIKIHSMNPVGRENMRAIIRRNGWTEVM